jgi:hypothetical protein
MEYVSVAEAAEMLNCTEQMIRQGILQGIYNFGIAIRCGTRRHKYYIYKTMLDRYVAERK